MKAHRLHAVFRADRASAIHEMRPPDVFRVGILERRFAEPVFRLKLLADHDAAGKHVVTFERDYLRLGSLEFFAQFNQLAKLAMTDRTPIGEDPNQHDGFLPAKIREPPRFALRVGELKITRGLADLQAPELGFVERGVSFSQL